MRMKLYFMLVRRVPPVDSPLLGEVFRTLRARGLEVEAGIAEEMVTAADRLLAEHDLYVLKSHTELSLSIAGVLHSRGARLLNPYPSCAATQNKIVTARRLADAGVPTPRCWVTGDLALMRSIAERCALIMKPYLGHRGAGIRIVRSPNELGTASPDRPVLIQEYVRGSGEDLKVYVVGEHVSAVRKAFSENSFAQPGRPCAVDAALRDVALRCGRALGLGLYGLDVIESADGPVVVDLNYFPGYKGVPDVAPLIAEYIEEYAEGRLALRLPGPGPARSASLPACEVPL